ncbi:GAP family protein [Actinomadura graeca]|uniref:GAP family protein n=1 Tax=Actinomadura graeca TaxID=2750812 RepID=A0ABX8QP55_9ACTN|nr:GAP family protein [Actinomadura graeca]QXJ20370.1 GAP family protein [Actinomadura graeca]
MNPKGSTTGAAEKFARSLPGLSPQVRVGSGEVGMAVGASGGRWTTGSEMGEVIRALLPLTLGVALSPIPITAVVALLLAPRARNAALGFLAGWTAGIVAVTTLLVVIANGIGMNSDTGGPKTPVSWIVLLLGVLVLTLAVRQWTSRGTGREGPAPLDGVTPLKAAEQGLVLAVLSPVNLLMFVAAGIAVSLGLLSLGEEVVAVAVFSVLAACGVAVPVILYLADAGRWRPRLEALRAWVESERRTAVSVLLLVIGVVLLGQGIGGLIG